MNSEILINGIRWIGNVEIHIKSSLWKIHEHDTDPAYNSVILHVVYENDMSCFRMDGVGIPCLELNSRIKDDTLSPYDDLKKSINFIPCS